LNKKLNCQAELSSTEAEPEEDSEISETPKKVEPLKGKKKARKKVKR
jgi:hypothetical protein